MLAFLFTLIAFVLFLLDALGVGANRRLMSWGLASFSLAFLVGYAPTKNPKVAIAALAVNDPVWKVKANVLAREALQAYFAQNGAPGVQLPQID